MHRDSIAKQLGKSSLCSCCRRRQTSTQRWEAEKDLYILCLPGHNEDKATSGSLFLDCSRATCLEMCGCVPCVSKGGGGVTANGSNEAFVAWKG